REPDAPGPPVLELLVQVAPPGIAAQDLGQPRRALGQVVGGRVDLTDGGLDARRDVPLLLEGRRRLSRAAERARHDSERSQRRQLLGGRSRLLGADLVEPRVVVLVVARQRPPVAHEIQLGHSNPSNRLVSVASGRGPRRMYHSWLKPRAKNSSGV